MVDRPAQALSHIYVDRGMPEAQRAAIGAVIADYGFADTPIDASIMQFSIDPPWCIELATQAASFFRAVADVAVPVGLGAAGGVAASALDLGAKLRHFFARLGAVPGRPDGSISLYDAQTRAKAAVYHPAISLPPEAYAALAGLPWDSFAASSPLLFPDPERRCWVAQRRGEEDQSFAWPRPADATIRGARRALIVTALGVEAAAVRANLAERAREDGPHGSVYTRGRFDTPTGEWAVLVAQVGRHNEQAAVATVHAAAHWRPEVVLFVGVAGGLKDVRTGDVVAATKVYAYSVGKQEDTFLPRPELQRGSYSLIQLANYLAQEGTWPPATDGAATASNSPRLLVEPIASGPQVLANSQAPLRAFLRQTYGDAVAIEQEGYGFHSALALQPEIGALVIRGISDTLDDKATATVNLSEDERRRRQAEDDSRQARAAKHAAALAFALLASLSPGPQQSAAGNDPGRAAVVTPTPPSAGAVDDGRQFPTPSTRSPTRVIAADVLLPDSRRWQEAEAKADAWSEQHRDQRSFPAPLPPKPWLLLHLVPYLPLDHAVPIARLRELALQHLPPPGQPGDFGAEDRDGGLLALPTRMRDRASSGFAMLWPTGHLAAALALPRGEAERGTGSLRRIEAVALGALESYVRALRALEVPLPIRIIITLAQIRGATLVDELATAAAHQPFSPDYYLLPNTLDDWDTAMPELFRERLDILWREAGYAGGSASFDSRGRWHP